VSWSNERPLENKELNAIIGDGLAVYYTKFSELLKLSREYQMLTVTKVIELMRPITGNPWVPEKLLLALAVEASRQKQTSRPGRSQKR
ncbi:hypothetical protein Tco_0975553, partial [Tanacetum coccineum]